jgi:mannose-6-phosphate isomerase-like protein (cupin superfamily)
MTQTLPFTIKNHLGEELIFHRIDIEEGEEKLIIENYIPPNTPPVKRTFYRQDECLIVLHGKLGYQVDGEEIKYAGIGETVFFKRGVPHRFWNAGKDELNCYGWIKPSNNVIFYLTALYQSMNETGKEKPGPFESAYLLYHYGKEFDIPEIPKFVKSVVLPAAYGIGKVAGKYQKFRSAPGVLK